MPEKKESLRSLFHIADKSGLRICNYGQGKIMQLLQLLLLLSWPQAF